MGERAARTLTRRTLLGTAVALCAACDPVGAAKQRKHHENERDVRVLHKVIIAEEAFVTLYTAAHRQHPGLATDIRPLTGHHRKHLAVLRQRLDLRMSSPSPSPSASSDTGAVPHVTVPDSETAALDALRSAEREAAGTRVEDLTHATPALAQLLASLGTCAATHAYLLGEGR